MMLKVGLTGGVACGKSAVAKMFADRGVRVLQADGIAHELLRPGEATHDEVVRHFGREILAADGTIDRAKLADAAFGTGRIQELNRIIHPEVIRRQEAWMSEAGTRDPQAIVMVEAALILEAGAGKRFDKLVVVTCPRELKIARFAGRQGIGMEAARAEVERRMKAQLPDEEKIEAADYVIENNDSLGALERRVEEVHRELKRLAAASTA